MPVTFIKEPQLINPANITLDKVNFNIAELKNGDTIIIKVPAFRYDVETCHTIFEKIQELFNDISKLELNYMFVWDDIEIIKQ